MTDNHIATVTAPAIEVTRMHPLVDAGIKALGQVPDAAALRELLAVQRDWEAGESKKAFTRASIALKKDLPAVLGHDKTVDYTSSAGRTHYTHTSLAAAMDAVSGSLSNHGFSMTWHPGMDGGQVTVTCRLTHVLGHTEETTLKAPPDAKGGKNGAQAVASTVTMLQRYTALALLGIATADMQEQHGPPEGSKESDPASTVDSKRNMAAVRAIGKKGLLVDDAVAMCDGRKPEQWTLADLDVLRPWINNDGRSATSEPAMRESGDD